MGDYFQFKKSKIKTIHIPLAIIRGNTVFRLDGVKSRKQLQHFNSTLLGATCCVRLVTLLRRVVTCWVLLAQI